MINKYTYERLTEDDYYENPCSNCTFIGSCIKECKEKIFYDRLTELEDKIEKGLLVELPCGIGEIVYKVYEKCESRNCPYNGLGGQWRCNYNGERRCRPFIEECAFYYSMINNIGKDTFLTKEEAEKRVKELEEKSNVE